MIEVLHNAARCFLQFLEVNQHADLIKLFAAHVNLDLPVSDRIAAWLPGKGSTGDGCPKETKGQSTPEEIRRKLNYNDWLHE